MAKYTKAKIEGLQTVEDVKAALEELRKELDSELRQSLDDTLKQFNQGGKNLEEWKRQLRLFSTAADQTSTTLDYITSSFKDSVNELKKQNQYLLSSRSIIFQLSKSASNLLDIRKGDMSFNKKNVQLAKDQLESQKRDLQLALERGNLNKAQKAEIRGVLKELDSYKDAIDEIIDRDKELNRQLGLAPQIASGLEKALGKLGLPDLGIADALDETKRLGQEAKAVGDDGFSPLGTFVKKVTGNLKEQLNFANLLQLSIGLFVKAFISADKAAGDLAKSMNITYSESLKVRDELGNIADDSSNAAITTRSLQETLIAINKEFGTSAMLNKENLKVYTSLREQAGMTNEEVMGIAKFTEATGGDAKKNVESFQAGAKAAMFQKNVTLNTKTLMADIGKLSKSQLLMYKDSAGALGNMMARVKATGIEMSKLESIAEGLLNFEQSIENELSAELLTGKELNLEKARSAALSNDMATLSEELTKQGITAANFTKMNRIQQEATAKALGMSKDELAEQLMTQDALNKIGKGKGLNDEEKKAFETAKAKYGVAEATKMLEEGQLGKMMQQQSIQERLTQLVEKMQEAFVRLAEPVMAIVSPIVDLLVPALSTISTIIGTTVDGVQKIFGLFTGSTKELGFWEATLGSIALIIGGIKAAQYAIMGYEKVSAFLSAAKAANEKFSLISLGGQIAKQAILTASKITAAVAEISGMSAATLGVAAGIALAAGAAAWAFFGSKKANDMMSPGDGSSGYGKRTLLGPEGAIQLNNKDTVIAGTKLFDQGDDVTSEPGKPIEKKAEGAIKMEKKTALVKGGVVDMSQTNALLQEMINLIQAGSIIQMDSQKVGQALRLGTRTIQ
jgi:hypothetical protein